jgi:cytochrome oxidase assembly protein ShyY1
VHARLIPTIAALLVLTSTVSLGVWQLRRADEKATAQTARDAALAAPPLRPGAAALGADALDGRRLELVGRFEPQRTLLLDNRTHRGVAGFHVLTPLRLDAGGVVVMVLRGWVARDVRDRTRVPVLPTPQGTVRIEGLAMAALPQPIVLSRDADAGERGSPIRQHFDLDTWRRVEAPGALPVVVRQTSDSADGLIRDWPQPGSGVDKHRGYAVQWFAMAFVTGVLWWRFGRRRSV